MLTPAWAEVPTATSRDPPPPRQGPRRYVRYVRYVRHVRYMHYLKLVGVELSRYVRYIH